MDKPSIVYTRTLELLNYILITGSNTTGYRERLDYNGYHRDGNIDEFKIFQDVVITNLALHDGLSTGASKLVNRIGKELHMNNALWYHKPETRKEYVVIKELVNKYILLKSEDPYIFFVNPMYIRRGTLQGVLAMTMKVLGQSVKPTTDHIRELRYKGKIDFNPMDIMNVGLIPKEMTKLVE